MKPIEIMIGIWVIYATRIVQIDGIAEGGYSVHLKGEGWVPVGDIEPIPITSDIVKAIGGKIVEVGDNGVLTPGQFINRYEKWEIKSKWCDIILWYDRITKGWRLRGVNSVRLDYVHKLQLALRLCGISKEIILEERK